MTTTANSPLSERLAALDFEEEISCLTGLPGHVITGVLMGIDTAPETSEQVWQAVQGLEAAQELYKMGINSEYCWVHPWPDGGWTCPVCRKEEEEGARNAEREQ